MTKRTPDLRDRINSRVVIEDRGYKTPCWISNRARQPNGYTKMCHLGKTWLTHRFAYTVFVGDIPPGMQLDHLCRVRPCCNPTHLDPVTPRENLLRGDTSTARQVAATHCPRGHKYSPENTYRRPDGSNKRDCLTCRRTWRQRAAA